MVIPLSLLLVADVTMSGASRLKYNPVPASPMLHHINPMIHTQVDLPQLQMKAADDADDADYDPDKFFSWSTRRFAKPCGAVVPSSTRHLVSYQQEGARHVWDFSKRISDQAFPPTVICGMNARRLLTSWVDSFLDPFNKQSVGADAKAIDASNRKTEGRPLLPRMSKYLEDDKATVLQKMRDVVSDFVGNFGNFEMVSLMPKDLETPFLESGSSAVDESVLALGVFSRRQLLDDSRGSICKALGKRYGEDWSVLEWWRTSKLLDAFEIEGLADAPGLPELSARILLSKLSVYAEKEQNILVVSQRAKRAMMGGDGKDVRDYYVRLGFEEVLMEDGKSELVYTGTCSEEDCFVESQQVMVGVSLEAGV